MFVSNVKPQIKIIAHILPVEKYDNDLESRILKTNLFFSFHQTRRHFLACFDFIFCCSSFIQALLSSQAKPRPLPALLGRSSF
jgi:hypothetical protein